MKILLTGATGFLGSHLTRKLVSEGSEVYVFIRPTSNSWRIRDVIQSVKVISCDLLSQEFGECLKRIQPDLCIHLAWCPDAGRNLNSFENVNFLSASLSLAASLADLGCKRFIGMGSCAEYATNEGYLSETSPIASNNMYAVCKYSLYLILEQLSKLKGVDITWIRPFYLYGPYEDSKRLIPSVIYSLLYSQRAKVTKGDQIRDFLYVNDAIDAIYEIMKTGLVGPVNIGSGNPSSVRDVVMKIGHILGRPEFIELGALPYSHFDPMYICADNSRLKANTRWVARYTLDDGLRDTVDWWKSRFGLIQRHSFV
jgi:nucleoside-diphosphate-sugar epimerase